MSLYVTEIEGQKHCSHLYTYTAMNTHSNGTGH